MHSSSSLLAIGLAFVGCLGAASAQSFENQLWFEDFSADGDGDRYVLDGRGVNASVTPVRGWDHSFLMPTIEPGGEYAFPAARGAIAWPSDGSGFSDAAIRALESLVSWAGGGSSLNISLIGPNGANAGSLPSGDAELLTALTGAGHSVDVMDAGSASNLGDSDLIFVSNTADWTSLAKRFDMRSLPEPIVTSNYQAAGDLLLTQSAGDGAARNLVQFDAPHPAVPRGVELGVQFDWTTGGNGAASFGALYDGVTPLATQLAPFATVVDRLAVVDAMIDGRAASVVATGQINEADLWDSGGTGVWQFNNPIPGGGGDDYAIVATGVFNVTQAGIFGVGIGSDDGGRLTIDGQPVIVDDGVSGFAYRAANLELPAGAHSFEWVGFERGGGSGFEISVIPDGETAPPVDASWDVLSTQSFFSEIGLDGPIDVTTYHLDVANSDLLPSDRPMIAVVDAGTQIDVPRNPFRTSDGPYLFASGFSDAGFENPTDFRSITFDPLDLSGATDPKLTLALAGDVAAYSVGGTGLRVLVNGEELVSFKGDVFGTLSDGEHVLTNHFKNLTYDLPNDLDSAQIVIEVSAADGDQLVGIDSVRISDGQLEGLSMYQTPIPNSFQQGVKGYSGTVDHEVWLEYPDLGQQDLHNLSEVARAADETGALSLEVDGGSSEVQILIRFDDIFGDGGIPLDARIESANLAFEVFDRGDPIRLHRLLQPWDDSDTWNSLGNGIQPNGVEATVEPESIGGDGKIEIGQVVFDVSESLRYFQEHPDENYGWVLLPSGTDGVSMLASELHEMPPDFLAAVNTLGPLQAFDPMEQIAPILTYVLASCITGDYDCNGVVDLIDFNLLKDNFGGPDDVFAAGSSNADGVIDLLDFNDMKANFGASAAAVPEPSAAGLTAALMFGGWLARVRRRRSTANGNAQG